MSVLHNIQKDIQGLSIKDEHLIARRDDFMSRPKRTWFTSEKENKLVPKAVLEEDYPPKYDYIKPFFAMSEGTSFQVTSFTKLNLSRPLLRACEMLGYSKPTPIQETCIQLALTGRDICASAITGCGKTAAFALPVMERLLFRPKHAPAIRVLVLTPTRKLAIQVNSIVQKLAQFTDIRCCLIVGDLPIKPQEATLKLMPDIVVATPDRIMEHLRNSLTTVLDDLSVLVLDDADLLLQLGYTAQIHELIRLCPKRRQTMLFSTTMTDDVDELASSSLTKPLRL